VAPECHPEGPAHQIQAWIALAYEKIENPKERRVRQAFHCIDSDRRQGGAQERSARRPAVALFCYLIDLVQRNCNRDQTKPDWILDAAPRLDRRDVKLKIAT